mgnify:CR=1 FL=1
MRGYIPTNVVKTNPEFGVELALTVPYAYWLHEQGKLGSMTVCNGMEPFYYFSQQYKAGFEQRRYVTPKGYPIQNIHNFHHRFL